MTPEQWDDLIRVVEGGARATPLTAFIADSPWLPGWCGRTVLDYYGDDRAWLECNLRAVREFPDTAFLPGFWSEYGMCTEPSAFGARCVWHERELPFAEACLRTAGDLRGVRRPDPRHDGLLPFALARLVRNRAAVERAGHVYRFAVARGPLNIASFLAGTTDFLMAVKEEPEAVQAMLGVITDFLVDWLRLQKEAMPSLDGIFLLDDLVGFLGADDVRDFAVPHLQRAFAAFPARIRFFHNDAPGLVCAPFLAGAGVNLFNFSHEHPIAEMRSRAGESVALLGNLPPRDVLAGGTPDDVRRGVAALRAATGGMKKVILSAGGGLAPGTPGANLRAFLATAAGG
jgi:uroporphyrinogen-III decarboxylase